MNLGPIKDLKVKDYITLSGTLSAFISIVFSIENWKPWYPALFIFLSMTFDLLDGYFARKMKESNEIGKELDSLSDAISFGLAPAVLVYATYSKSQLFTYRNTPGSNIPGFPAYVLIIPCFIFIFGAIVRLAWFNVEQSEKYIGLVTPQSGLVATLLVLADYSWYNSDALSYTVPYQPIMKYINLGVLLLLAYLNLCPYLVYGGNVKKKKGPVKNLILAMGIMLYFVILLGIFFEVIASFFIEFISLFIVGMVVGYTIYGFRNWLKYERKRENNTKTIEKDNY